MYIVLLLSLSIKRWRIALAGYVSALPYSTNECLHLASSDILSNVEQVNYKHERKWHNPAKCISIALVGDNPKGSVTEYVPAFLLLNVMTLSSKLDEVREIIRCGNYEFVSLVETWLQSLFHDNVINILGYYLIRTERESKASMVVFV